MLETLLTGFLVIGILLLLAQTLGGPPVLQILGMNYAMNYTTLDGDTALLIYTFHEYGGMFSSVTILSIIYSYLLVEGYYARDATKGPKDSNGH